MQTLPSCTKHVQSSLDFSPGSNRLLKSRQTEECSFVGKVLLLNFGGFGGSQKHKRESNKKRQSAAAQHSPGGAQLEWRKKQQNSRWYYALVKSAVQLLVAYFFLLRIQKNTVSTRFFFMNVWQANCHLFFSQVYGFFYDTSQVLKSARNAGKHLITLGWVAFYGHAKTFGKVSFNEYNLWQWY